MTIILFLIDTSASMCQKVHVNGVQKTYLDVAKGAVETFLKFRQRSQDCMGDRYMLLTFEEPPANVKAGWKENHATFMNELKNLQSNGLTCMGEALKNGFDLLNLNRMQSGIDTYGQGRCPFYLETSVIIVITDGGKYSFRNGVHNEIVLPLHAQIPGTKLTKEPFRWDQRLFSLVLRMAGHRVDERIDIKVPHDDSPIEKMCEVTGGRSYKVRSHYVLNHCIESLVQKVQPGVVVQFDQSLPPLSPGAGTKDPTKEGGVDLPDLVFPPTKKMIFVQKNISNKNYPVGYWPLPEPYWPDVKAIQLPPRDAHPRLRVLTPCVDEPVPVRNFPVDKYELEASPLTMQILARREVNRCWPVVVVNSGPGPMGIAAGLPMAQELPFGYLKANNTLTQVYLVVLPFNYPQLLPLLQDLFHRYMGNPPNDWMYKFSNYVRSIPHYYCPFLRRALATISVPYQLLSYTIPENLDSPSPAVGNHLKALKNAAKQELEALCMRVFKQMKQPRPAHKQVETAKLVPILALTGGVTGTGAAAVAGPGPNGVGQQQLQQQPPPPLGGTRKEMVSHPMLRDTFAKIHSDCQVYDNYTIVIPVATIRGQLTGSAPVTHAAAGGGALGPAGGGPLIRTSRNPFDIRRRDLVDEIARMRENFFKLGSGTVGAGNGVAGHCLPISEMGNYQEYLKNKETPLREIEPTNVRQHMFGNPYKKDKHMVMVDEADMVGDVAPMMKTGGGGQSPVGMGGGGGGAGPGGTPQQLMSGGKKLDGMVPKMSRKRKAGPIARDFKFRRLSTSSMESYGSSGSSSSGVGDQSALKDEYCSSGSSLASDDFDDEEQRLVMDFDEVAGVRDGDTADERTSCSIDAIDVEGLGVSGTARNGNDQEDRVNGSGGSSSVVAGSTLRDEEVTASGTTILINERLSDIGQPSVPLVLTPSEGVLSPMYRQQSPVGVCGPTLVSGAVAVAIVATTTPPPPPSNSVSVLPAGSSSSLNLVGMPGTTGESRKEMSNGNGGGAGVIAPSSTTTPVVATSISLDRATSSPATSSNYNDADEISKILQQSCAQQNGGTVSTTTTVSSAATLSEQEPQRKKGNARGDRTTESTTSSGGGSGRKRRQLGKQASVELLEVNTSGGEATEEKDGEGVISTTTAAGRRQSPRMAESSNVAGTKSHSNSNSSTNSVPTHDRLSAGTGPDESTANTTRMNHGKGGWAAGRKVTRNNLNHTNSRSNKIKDEVEDGEEIVENVDDDSGGGGGPVGAWMTNGETVEMVREANYEARSIVFHDIRRPGRDYRLLLEHLELVRGDFETQFAFIQMCIAEAIRFHRKKMATTIQEWWDQKIDRITTPGSGSSANTNINSSHKEDGEPDRGIGRRGTAPPVAAQAAATAARVESGGPGQTKAGRQKPNVKLRSGATTASKC